MLERVYYSMNVATAPQFFDDVTRHYAQVFSALPQEVLTDLRLFVQWIEDHPVLQSLLCENSLPLWWHETVFDAFHQVHPCQELTLRTLRVLSTQKRLDILSNILRVLLEMESPHTTVYWHTAKLFSPSDVAILEKTLSDAFGTSIVVCQKEKSDLLLGGVLLWDDSMIDLSLSNILSNLYNEIDHVLTCS